MGHIFEIDKTGGYIPILPPQINLNGNFLVSSTTFIIQPFWDKC